jgi:NADH-quinone oxidoreductase subunit C
VADEPKTPEPPSPPQAAGDKPAGSDQAEPLKAEVSRTDAPGAGVSAAPPAAPRTEPPAPKPENPTAAQTATTSETSSATGQPTPPASAAPPAAAATAGKPATPPAKPAPAAARPAAPAAAGAKPAAPAAAKPAGEAHVPKAAPPSGPTEPPPPADAVQPPFIAALSNAVAGSVAQVSFYLGDWTVIVPPAHILSAMQFLRDDPGSAFDYLSDLTATDWPPRAERFDVVYCLYSTRHRHRVRIKARVAENQPLASVTGVWPAANWLEREVYDMFGVNFTGHPDRRRILMPEDWQGFPQRKDYPLEGPGELLMENPIDWLKLRQAREEADIE